MRITHVSQASIFENFLTHEYGMQLKALSESLDKMPELLALIANDLLVETVKPVGRIGLSVETIFRCLLLRQRFKLSYKQLAFHLSDSITYRTFVRIPDNIFPSRSGLQSTIRLITSETLEKIHIFMTKIWLKDGTISLGTVRIDSTVVDSNITPPSDS